MNRNVLAVYIASITTNAANGIWSFVVLPALLLQLTGENSKVGLAEGFQGVSRVVFALPSGALADAKCCGRSGMLRAAGAFGVVTIVASVAIMLLPFVCAGVPPVAPTNHTFPANRTSPTSSDAPAIAHCAVLAEEPAQFALICFALCMWGAFQGMRGSAMQSIFADSVPTGERSCPTTLNTILSRLGSLVGPLVALAIFFARGDTWTLRELRIVFIAGQVACIFPTVVLFFFDDKLALGEQSEGAGRKSGSGKVPAAELVDPIAFEATGEEGAVAAALAEGEPAAAEELSTAAAAAAAAEEAVEMPAASTQRWWCIGRRAVPYVIVASDFTMGVASGMTIRFFPLFFQHEVGLSPVRVNAIYAVVMVCLAFAGGAARYTSMSIGRVTTMIATKLLGIACLVAMAAGRAWWSTPLVIVPIYIVRTTLMNCTCVGPYMSENVPVLFARSPLPTTCL